MIFFKFIQLLILMRLFVGIQLSEPVKEALCSLCRELKKDAPKIRWVKEDNIHVTLKFLGETEKKDQIMDALKNKVSTQKFKLEFQGLGSFGRGLDLRILWAGISACSELDSLFSQIEETLEPLGFPKETRRFSPHITLGRNRHGRIDEAFSEKISRLTDHDFGIEDVTSFQLISSTLKLDGPIYRTIETFPLQ